MDEFTERKALFDRGIDFYREKKYDEALECFRRVAEESPNNHVIQHFLGLAKLRTGNASSALVNLAFEEKLMQTSNLSPEKKASLQKHIIFSRALCFCVLEEFEKAAVILLEHLDKEIGDN